MIVSTTIPATVVCILVGLMYQMNISLAQIQVRISLILCIIVSTSILLWA